MEDLKINIHVNETADGEPESVTITGAYMLASSAIADMAQEAVDSFLGTFRHRYVALRVEDWHDMDEDQKSNVTVTLHKRD